MFEYDLRFRLLDFSFLSSDSHSASTIAHKLQIVMQNPSEPLKKRSSIAGSLRWIALKSFRRSSMHLVYYQLLVLIWESFFAAYSSILHHHLSRYQPPLLVHIA